MKLYLCSILILLVNYGSCDSAIHVGHRISLAVPSEYSAGFIGRAFLMDANQLEPNFRVALSAEAIKGKYSCSLEVFLGDVKIASWRIQPLRFLALGNKTGNLGLYFYSPNTEKFEASFQALNSTCDLPLACKPYGICTFSNACSCIRLLTKQNGMSSDCNEGTPRKFCGGAQVEMVELNGVSSVLRDAPRRVNVSKTACANLCLDDCKCVAALHSSEDGAENSQECFLYRLVVGIKQVERGTGLSYMVKVPKGIHDSHSKPSVKKWVLIVVGVVDGLIIVLVLGGLAYYLIQKRRKNLSGTENNT
ncbi:D-mannose binding lectin protein with Apple-like carbohydrate-binding domain isoform 3 [Theobroma cacao]|uniref:D-mannose binding lectin protein with Apple-like carbohydrate-binding domain isoform 3 n=1 Tax=Theobroma cacao TaxID=3641 RepID=A0A061EQB2_THECC|nr:D-mannose binding lectin protein with Apple-like carbohydrate-binding domain isoform 3 [Theobroma cacao]